jgi:hypothetical protein
MGTQVSRAIHIFGKVLIYSRLSFNITLAIVGVFAMIAAASPNFTALAIFAALWSVGVRRLTLRFDTCIELMSYSRSAATFLLIVPFSSSFSLQLINICSPCLLYGVLLVLYLLVWSLGLSCHVSRVK